MSNRERGSAYKAVIFDLFGTLIDHYSRTKAEQFLTDLAELADAPRSALVEVWKATGPTALTGGFDSIEEDMRCVLGRVVDGPVSSYQVSAAVKMKLDLVRGFLQAHRPTSLETLACLKDMGFIIGLISGCGPDVPELWSGLPFSGYITDPVFSCEVGINKPDIRIYELCCKRLGVPPEECIYIADGSGGELSAARKYGMTAILLKTPLDDVYDPIREDVQKWDGLKINELIEIKQIVKQRLYSRD